MKLRKLDMSDAPLMLEWMHDESIVKDLNANFLSKTISDCEKFIQQSWSDKYNYHSAIEFCDEYMGTISLKNIEYNKAEFAIVIRKKAMAKGIAKDAMAEMLRVGFEEMGLSKIYWYVDRKNNRALKFYDKNGYQRIDNTKNTEEDTTADYIWYQVER